MIVSIAARCNDERIFVIVSRPRCVLLVVFLTTSVRPERCAYRVLARPTLTKCSLFALRAIQPVISLTASRLLLDSNVMFVVATREHRMHRLQLKFGPSHLAVIVLVDFTCMALLVLLSL